MSICFHKIDEIGGCSMKDLYLAHHGVKGMKWGVRRYQNKDGSLTDLGKSRSRAIKTAKTKKDVDDIVSTFSKKERDLFGLHGNDEEYLTLDQGEYVVKRILLKDKNIPIAFFDILDDGNSMNIAIGTRSGDSYRGKGYATRVAKAGINWYDKNASKFGNKPLVWAPQLENTVSRRIAENLGFELDPSSISKDGKWINYVKRYN